MPKKYFIIRINNNVEIQVAFETIHGLIVDFVGKLILKKNGKHCEVIRFDSGHNCPHKDILSHGGKTIKKIWYELLDNKQALDLAIKDLKENYEIYIERFEKR